MKKRVIYVVTLITLMIIALSITIVAEDTTEGITVTIPLVEGEVNIDGEPDEALLAIAEKAGSYLTVWEVNTGGESLVETEAWIFWDKDNLYVVFRNWQFTDLRLVRLHRRDGDPIWRDDDNEVFLAPDWPEPEPYYQFITNANAARLEGKGQDTTWSSDWQVATSIHSDHWITEFAIPFKDFNKTPEVGDKWGFNVTRHWVFGSEWITFTPGLESFHTPEGFSTLEFGPAID